MTEKFNEDLLKGLWKPKHSSHGDDNGQITIVGGSSLFQGAPLMSLVAATRLVDNVFIATPEEDKYIINKEALFSMLRSVIWVPREDLEQYIAKSDAILIGPGLMRYHREGSESNELGKKLDEAGNYTRELTHKWLKRFPDKKWVIDGGSLQTIEAEWIPRGAIVTPNMREFELLFKQPLTEEAVKDMAEKYKCVVVGKDHVTYVSDGYKTYLLDGGNAGLTKGGTGDVLAGVTVGLLAKNEPMLAATSASYLVKKTAEELFKTVGFGFNADDVARQVFEVKKQIIGY